MLFFNTIVHPKDYDGLMIFLTLLMKISGIFPIKIVSNKTKLEIVICKWGVCCTIVHLIVYLSSLIYSSIHTNFYIINRPGGSVGIFGAYLMMISELFSTISIFISVFYSLRFQRISFKKYFKIKQIYEELKIDAMALIRRSIHLIYLLISLLCIHLTLGVILVMYSFYTIFKKFPPINLLFLTILSHFYIFITVSHFLVVAIILNSTYKELIKLVKVIGTKN